MIVTIELAHGRSFNQVLEYDKLACTNNISNVLTFHQNSNSKRLPQDRIWEVILNRYLKHKHRLCSKILTDYQGFVFQATTLENEETKVDDRFHADTYPSNGALYPAYHKPH